MLFSILRRSTVGVVLPVLSCLLVWLQSATAAELDGEGVGEKALRGIWKGKDPAAAAKLALRERRPELAATAFAMYLRSEKELSGPSAHKVISQFGRRKGMRDRAALILAFNSNSQRHDGKILEALMASDDEEDHELAAALLATIYCYQYTSAPANLASSRHDLKSKAPDKHGAKLNAKPKGKRRPGTGRARIKLQGIPPIADELFSARERETVELAAIAAAFNGDARYKEHLMSIGKPSPRQAGAILLYVARQKEAMSEAQVAGLFRASLGASSGVRRLGQNRQEQPDVLFSPLLPGGCLACMGIAELGDAKYLPLLLQAMQSGDEQVQVDAVRAIRRLGPNDKALAALSQSVLDSPWPVLVELCATLGAHPDKRLVPALVKRLDKEKGRFRLDLVHALSSIAGEQKGRTADEWIQWWRANGATFEVDPAASMRYRQTTRVQDVDIPALGNFYGLPIFSDHLVYVVDTSLSMRGARIDSLRENLVQSLESLKSEGGRTLRGDDKPAVHYNLVDFGGDVVTMYSGALTDDLRDGQKRAETMPMTLGTRSFDAMERGMRLPEVDSIYFLSDGAPVWGQLEKWGSIISSMELIMLYRPVALWSVAFDPSGGNQAAMTWMAEENFGRYEAPVM